MKNTACNFTRVIQCVAITLALLFTIATSKLDGAKVENKSTIYIIRHGEKKWLLGCLSKEGEARANALESIFQQRFKLPNRVFANFYDDHVDCERCIETVTPIANKLGLPVNSSFGFNKVLGGNLRASDAFKSSIRSSTTPQVILVAWEHLNIKPLTIALGVPKEEIPSWKSSDFDTVYILSFNSSGHLMSFNISAEDYHPR